MRLIERKHERIESFMKSRPKLDSPKTTFAKVAERVSFVLVAWMVVLSVVTWIDLPNQIPVHFSVFGESGRMGGKASIFIFPIIGFFSTLFLSFVSKGTDMLSYPVKVTEENAERLYRESIRMLHLIQILIIALLTFLHADIILKAYGKSGLGNWMMPTFLILFVSVIVLSIYRMIKMK